MTVTIFNCVLASALVIASLVLYDASSWNNPSTLSDIFFDVVKYLAVSSSHICCGLSILLLSFSTKPRALITCSILNAVTYVDLAGFLYRLKRSIIYLIFYHVTRCTGLIWVVFSMFALFTRPPYAAKVLAIMPADVVPATPSEPEASKSKV